MIEVKKNSRLDVSIIIPNYNTQDLLKKNLPEVLAAYKNKKNHIREVILVDDASPDDSAKVVKDLFPEIKLVRHKVNRGFSASVNTGARTSKGKLLALINTDVVPDKNFLENVIEHFRDKQVFAVSLHEKGYGWAKAKFEDGFIGHEKGRESKSIHDTFWVNGGSGVFRRSYWMRLGGMDEALLSPFYWEDLDLCYRAVKRGWKLLWEPKAMVLHEHESTMKTLSDQKRVGRIRERNQLILIWKNLTSPNLFRKHISGLLKRVSRHPGYLRIVLMAITRYPGIRKARKKEKKESKVSDEAIFARFN